MSSPTPRVHDLIAKFCDVLLYSVKSPLFPLSSTDLCLSLSVCPLSFQVEAGDVIVKVNGTDVHRFSTKEGESRFDCLSGCPSGCLISRMASLQFACGMIMLMMKCIRTQRKDRTARAVIRWHFRLHILIILQLHIVDVFFLIVAVLKCLRLSKDSVTLDLKRGNEQWEEEGRNSSNWLCWCCFSIVFVFLSVYHLQLNSFHVYSLDYVGRGWNGDQLFSLHNLIPSQLLIESSVMKFYGIHTWCFVVCSLRTSRWVELFTFVPIGRENIVFM